VTKRIAVFGGSFDPIHLGHLVPTIRAQETFRFDAVHFVPSRRPPHKQGQPMTPVTHRFAMVALATLPFPGFFVSDEEVFAREPTFTVDTVLHFRQHNADAALYFLMGSDSFSHLSTWDRWEELVDLTHLVVLRRAHMWGEELERQVPSQLLSRITVVKPFSSVDDSDRPVIYLLDHEPFPISATSIRDRQHRGLPIRELVPHEVNSYIEKYGLYRYPSEVTSDDGAR